jgi:recombination protein RecR
MLPKPVQKLVDDFASLPGVGRKSATRMVLYLLDAPDYVNERLASDIADIKDKVTKCTTCFNLSENGQCFVCKDQSRDDSRLVVVESPLDIIAIEPAGFRGKYHVLGGLISPLQGIGPDEIRINELLRRIEEIIKEEKKLEIIFACPTSLEGESTVTYIRKLIGEKFKEKANSEIILSKIARGLPTNSSIEYQDPQTLEEAFANRQGF